MKLFDLAMLARPLELLWMTGLFVVIAWRALSPRRRRHHEQNAMIPLRDDAAMIALSADGGGGERGQIGQSGAVAVPAATRHRELRRGAGP